MRFLWALSIFWSSFNVLKEKMVGRQVVTSGAPHANGLAAFMTASSVALTTVTSSPFGLSSQVKTAEQPVEWAKVEEKLNKMTPAQEEELKTRLEALLKISDPVERSHAMIAWTSAGTNLAAITAFVDVVKMLGNSDTCGKFSLDSTHGSELANKMKEVAARAFIDATEQFPLNTLLQLQCPSPQFQKGWLELVKMVGAVEPKAVKTAPAGTTVRVEEADWFNNALETQQAKYMSLLEQEINNMSTQQSSIFGAGAGVVRKHPLLLNKPQFSRYIAKGAIFGIVDETKKAEIHANWKLLEDMMKLSKNVQVLDAIVAAPAAAVWKSVAPNSTHIVDALAKKNLYKLGSKHGLVAANYIAKQSIMSSNPKVKHVGALINDIIPSDDLPTSTGHHAVMSRLTAFAEDPITRFAEVKPNEKIMEEVLSHADCLKLVYPKYTQNSLGKPNSTPYKFMTAKLNDKQERVIVDDKVQVIPVDSVDPSIKNMVQQFIRGHALMAAAEIGNSKNPSSAASGVSQDNSQSSIPI